MQVKKHRTMVIEKAIPKIKNDLGMEILWSLRLNAL